MRETFLNACALLAGIIAPSLFLFFVAVIGPVLFEAMLEIHQRVHLFLPPPLQANFFQLLACGR